MFHILYYVNLHLGLNFIEFPESINFLVFQVLKFLTTKIYLPYDLSHDWKVHFKLYKTIYSELEFWCLFYNCDYVFNRYTKLNRILQWIYNQQKCPVTLEFNGREGMGLAFAFCFLARSSSKIHRHVISGAVCQQYIATLSVVPYASIAMLSVMSFASIATLSA